DDGIVQIKGPSVTTGYWRNPEKTAEAFTADGYFITGDVGRQDPDGRLWLSGRSSDLIISGGLNVYPKEIELVLDEMAGVVESAMIAAARAQLAAFKCPKRVIFVADLPRNAMGKVLKAELRKRYADTFG